MEILFLAHSRNLALSFSVRYQKNRTNVSNLRTFFPEGYATMATLLLYLVQHRNVLFFNVNFSPIFKANVYWWMEIFFLVFRFI